MKYLIIIITFLMLSCAEEELIKSTKCSNCENSYVLLNTSDNLKYIDSISFLEDNIIGDEIRKSIKFHVDTSYFVINYSVGPSLDSINIASQLQPGFLKYSLFDNNKNIMSGDILIVGSVDNPSVQAKGFVDNKFFTLVYLVD